MGFAGHMSKKALIFASGNQTSGVCYFRGPENIVLKREAHTHVRAKRANRKVSAD